MGRLADGPAKVAATNKYLRKSNKFSTGPKATKGIARSSASWSIGNI